MPSLRKTLGENIHDCRTNARRTQLQLAHAVGYHGPGAGAYISRLEHGHQQPRLPMVHKIAKALRVSVKTLIS